MTKNLLQKTSTAYLIFSVLLLLIAAPVFYYFTEKLYIEEIDETLILSKNEFLKNTLPVLSLSEMQNWNNYNTNVKIEPIKNNSIDTLFYTSSYDTLEAELEPYRELNTPISLQGQPFTYVARVNLVETEDLMKSIAILFFSVIFVLLLGLFFITKKLSRSLWKPFYETLHQMEEIEIDKNKQPFFSSGDIEEFNRLNQSIEKFIKKNLLIYKNQREFIENAAHELQTPLAVFQAKIDTLIQRSDITKEQAEILNSLNDSVSRLNRLNKNLLLLSKIENENYSDKQSVLWSEMIVKHKAFFEEQAKAKNLTIVIQTLETPETKSNPVLAEILFNNLFLNAIRHNSKDGKIEVTLSNHSLIFSNTGQNSPLVDDKLFKRFSKSNPSEQGNGLGLSIVKKIADINNWSVSYIYSESLHSFSVSF
jgi:two-component system, OmpR family, sensor histidine kinase ArlS